MRHLSLFLAAFVVASCASVPLGATQEQTDNTTSPFPQWIQPGMYVGKAPSGTAPGSQVASGNVALQVFGDAGINGGLVVSGAFTQTGNTTTNGNEQINGDAGVAGVQQATLGFQLGTALDFLTDQGGVATFDGGVNVKGSLTVAAGNSGYIPSSTPAILFGMGAVTFSNGTVLQGYNIGQNFTSTAIVGKLTTASAGTGSVTVTGTDGTNTCTYTGTCSGSLPSTGLAGTATYRLAATNGAGTGCVWTTANPSITWSVSASNCGTTTPIGSFGVEGKWQ